MYIIYNLIHNMFANINTIRVYVHIIKVSVFVNSVEYTTYIFGFFFIHTYYVYTVWFPF